MKNCKYALNVLTDIKRRGIFFMQVWVENVLFCIEQGIFIVSNIYRLSES